MNPDHPVGAGTLDRGAARSVVVAGIGGLVLGHILWLLGISAATAARSVSTAVLLVSVGMLAAAGFAIHRAWAAYQARRWVRAAFLAGLSVSPVVFTVVVLGVTYL